MRALTLIAFLVVIAIPASAAEPWEGVYTHVPPAERDAFQAAQRIWSKDEGRPDGVDACDLEPYHDLVPTRYSENEIRGYESHCEILKVTKIRNMSAWIFDVDCGDDDGRRRPSRELIMLTKNPEGILVYYEHRYAAQLYRCPF